MIITPREFIYFSTQDLLSIVRWRAVDLYLLRSRKIDDEIAIRDKEREIERLEFEIYRRTKGQSYNEQINEIKKRIKNEIIDKYQDKYSCAIANKIINIIDGK